MILTIAVGTGGTVDINTLGALASSPYYKFNIDNINDAASGIALAKSVYTTLMSSKQLFSNHVP